MASGPEMMVKALLKAIGFDPEAFTRDLSGFLSWTKTSIEDMQHRVNKSEQTVERLEAKIDLLILYQQGRIIEHGRHQQSVSEYRDDAGDQSAGRNDQPEPQVDGGAEPATERSYPNCASGRNVAA
jgi:hypothetical protein